MTAAERILEQAAVAGCDITLKPDGSPAVTGRPNAALLAQLRHHRRDIIRLLGGEVEAEQCERCSAWVYEAIDEEAFCFPRKCPVRRRLR